MNEEKFPLREDFYMGENPQNLPPHQVSTDLGDDFGEPLPEKFANKLPEYFKIFCKPYISKNGQVKFNIELSEEFYNAIKIHYSMKSKPSREKLCEILEFEIKNALKNI